MQFSRQNIIAATVVVGLMKQSTHAIALKPHISTHEYEEQPTLSLHRQGPDGRHRIPHQKKMTTLTPQADLPSSRPVLSLGLHKRTIACKRSMQDQTSRLPENEQGAEKSFAGKYPELQKYLSELKQAKKQAELKAKEDQTDNSFVEPWEADQASAGFDIRDISVGTVITIQAIIQIGVMLIIEQSENGCC